MSAATRSVEWAGATASSRLPRLAGGKGFAAGHGGRAHCAEGFSGSHRGASLSGVVADQGVGRRTREGGVAREHTAEPAFNAPLHGEPGGCGFSMDRLRRGWKSSGCRMGRVDPHRLPVVARLHRADAFVRRSAKVSAKAYSCPCSGQLPPFSALSVSQGRAPARAPSRVSIVPMHGNSVSRPSSVATRTPARRLRPSR